MKKKIREYFLRQVLFRFSKHPAPDRIPLSSPSVNDRNYYTVRLRWEAPMVVLLTGFDGTTIRGKRFDGTKHSIEYSTSLENAATADIEITYYYRRFEFNSQNPVAFELLCRLQFQWLTVRWSDFIQWLYNKKSLVTVERFDLLRMMVDRTIERPNIIFHPVYLAGDKSRRAVFHPGFKRTTAYYSLLLNSLVEDGLVEKTNNEYKITPKAFGALSEYEDEKRRHISANRLQFLVAFFGIVSAIGTLVQAWPVLKDLFK